MRMEVSLLYGAKMNAVERGGYHLDSGRSIDRMVLELERTLKAGQTLVGNCKGRQGVRTLVCANIHVELKPRELLRY
jgi:hypothetical protein